tara:strand:+ start:10560 stop:11297 length:738 start_codon:yes stop_codon:yes gene_type:complete
LIVPKKSLGQNFLKDKNIVKKIIKSINIIDKKFIEIGPGYGILTNEILKLNPKKFFIIEKDKTLYKYLLNKLQNNSFKIINEDALKFDYSRFSNYTIVSNLPYNISSKFLLKTIKLNKNFNEIICMIQSELAEKFDYRVGKMNKYKFLAKFCGEYQILFNVSPKVFFPQPKVNSKVVKFVLSKKNIKIENLDLFVKLFFVNKRKKIKSNKTFNNLVDKKLIDKRYEDLNYNDILMIYKRFDLFIS